MNPVAPATVALLARRGLRPGAVGITLYNDRRPDLLATPAVLQALQAWQPDAVRIHAGPRALLGCDPDQRTNKGIAPVVLALRSALPRAQLELGVGVDGWTRSAAAGQLTEATDMLKRCAELAHSHGMRTVGWNGEAAIYNAPVPGARLGAAVLRTVRERYPELVQLFSSYGGMADPEHALCYRAWAGADGWEPQWYCIDDELLKAHPDFEVGPGMLSGRFRTGRASGDALAHAGGIPSTWREVTVPYAQSYRARPSELLAVLRAEPIVQLWCMGPSGPKDGTCFDLRAQRALVQLRSGA